MIYLWAHLVLMLIIILAASQLFTNALEHFGERIGISAGVTGSIFASIATALPETSIPIIALFAGTANKSVNQEISVGAILGSSLMLSTLSTFLVAISVIKKRGINGRLVPERTGFIRDINFFLIAFFLAAITLYIPLEPVYLRPIISVLLIAIYIIYMTLTFMASKNLVSKGHGVSPEDPMILTRLGFSNTALTTGIQLVTALILLLVGAKGFITSVQAVSNSLGLSVLLLSLLIIPIATELPEKVNSIFWVRKNKDTLGFGNITGAMVFQGTLLPAIGILLTPWQPSRIMVIGIFITLLAALWLRINASINGLLIKALLVNGVLYLLYIYLVFN